jgi:uncharacterized protein (TIGR02147 family)
LTPSVFQYLDYRAYLRDVIDARRSASSAFSLEALGRRTGCLTKSHLSLILAGKRSLTPQRATALGRALGLDDGELRYYERLVQFNQAKDDAGREQHLAALLADVRRRTGPNLPLESYRVLESWHGLVVRELARRPGFDPAPAAIAARLKGFLTAAEARRAVRTLVETGLLAEAADGALVPTDETIRTADEISSLAVRQYHRSCLDLAKRVLESEPVASREFGSVNLLVRPEDKPRLKDLIKTFREQVLALAAPEGASAARVTQVNVQMFDLTE